MSTITKVQKNEQIYYICIPKDMCVVAGIRKGDHIFWSVNEKRQLILTQINENSYPDVFKRIREGAQHNAGIKSSI